MEEGLAGRVRVDPDRHEKRQVGHYCVLPEGPWNPFGPQFSEVLVRISEFPPDKTPQPAGDHQGSTVVKGVLGIAIGKNVSPSTEINPIHL